MNYVNKVSLKISRGLNKCLKTINVNKINFEGKKRKEEKIGVSTYTKLAVNVIKPYTYDNREGFCPTE